MLLAVCMDGHKTFLSTQEATATLYSQLPLLHALHALRTTVCISNLVNAHCKHEPILKEFKKRIELSYI